MYQSVSYPNQFTPWGRNSTALVSEEGGKPISMDTLAQTLCIYEFRGEYDRYEWLVNFMVSSLEANAYLDVLCKLCNARPAGS